MKAETIRTRDDQLADKMIERASILPDSSTRTPVWGFWDRKTTKENDRQCVTLESALGKFVDEQ